MELRVRPIRRGHLAAHWSDSGVNAGSALCPVGELSFKPLYHALQLRTVFRARSSVFRAEVGERFLHRSAPACVKEVVHDKGTCCLRPKGNSAFVKNLFVVLKGDGDRRQTGHSQALEEKECQSLAKATRTYQRAFRPGRPRLPYPLTAGDTPSAGQP
jgi:hypothetical protein